jgi:hypothetical protein
MLISYPLACLQQTNKGTTAMAGNLFDRLNARRPPPIEITLPVNLKLLPIGRLLNWLLNYWDEPTISASQIYVYGPRPRDPKSAISAAEILVRRGWLTPLRTHRHDRKVWLINRDAEQIAAE